MAEKAIAYANNDVGFLAWQYDQKIPGCLGFAVYRTDLASNKTIALPAWVGFKGQENKNWQPETTEQWPIQKYSWRDLTAERGHSYQYQVIPMVGTVGDLKPAKDHALTTQPVHLTPTYGHISAYFNRGILSTQSLAHKIPEGPSGAPNYQTLLSHIDKLSDPLRTSLAGQLLDALPSLLERAKTEGGQCYCALYELNDPYMISLLKGNSKVHIILSNTGTDDAVDRDSRKTLHDSGVDITDRMLNSGHIGHNKFVVYTDKNDQPQAVLTGSTNWTYTALCAQSNNCIIIESPDLAAFYLDYWHRLKAEQSAQSLAFRKKNNQVHDVEIDDKDVHLWFSPNTDHQTEAKTNPAEPLDLNEVFQVIDGAQQGIIFLLFQPGSPSIMTETLARQQANSSLFIRGAVTDPKAVKDYDVQLYHRTGEDPDTVVAAAGIKDQFSVWQEELLKSSPDAHAIIHDKIIVVDPLSSNCAVITGSHNLGYRASYTNDENLLILRGNSAVAQAYAVHVMDVYDHYRWRYTLQTDKANAWSFLDSSDNWQDKYFTTPNITREVKFWVGN